MELDPSTFATMSPEEFARLIGSMSDAEITEVMTGEHRQSIIDAIFGRMPDLFRPEKAQGIDKVAQFRISGGPEESPVDIRQVAIRDGAAALLTDQVDDPDVSLQMGPVEFAKIIVGKGNPTMMVMRGKVTVRGDIGLAASFPSYFALPKG